MSVRSARGLKARRSGRWAEVWAAVCLILKGYRVLGFRLKTLQAEFDILALRGRVLAVVEVKSRATMEAALEAVSFDQRQRRRSAGTALATSRRGLQGAAVRLNLLALAHGRFPRHVPDA